MKLRTKVLLLIPHLGGGGAERVAGELARLLDAEMFEVHLVVFTANRAGAEALPRWVRVHRFDGRRVRDGWWRLLRLLRREQPCVVLSGMAHLNFLVLLLRPLLPAGVAVLVRQNTTASQAATGWGTRWGYRFLYPRADAIVCQSEAMAGDLIAEFGIAREKIRVLRNPVDVDAIRRELEAGDGVNPTHLWGEGAWPRLVSVGRLAPEKGFDLLLGALACLRERYPRVQAIVLGEGAERGSLERFRDGLGLADAVRFVGHRRKAARWFREATLFVLPSRMEGMPNALLEAAACGLPLAATRCCGGVVEMLEGAPGAWLCDAFTAESLACAMVEALGGTGGEAGEPTRFEHAFLKPFEASAAIGAYAALLESFGRADEVAIYE